MREDFVIQDGKVIHTRTADDRALLAHAKTREEMAIEWVKQNRHIRPIASFDARVQMEIINKYGPEMDPARVGKMTDAEYRKFDRILRSEYPKLRTGLTEQRYFNGI